MPATRLATAGALRHAARHGSRTGWMRVHLRPQRRTVEIHGRRTVAAVLAELGVLPSTAMVIRGDRLLLDDDILEDHDEIEVRAVISGGSAA